MYVRHNVVAGKMIAHGKLVISSHYYGRGVCDSSDYLWVYGGVIQWFCTENLVLI